FHPFLLPGLLHTKEYATAVLSTVNNPEHTQRKVELRAKRQQYLFTNQAVQLAFILQEEALYRWIGGPAAMATQLQQLRKIGEQPNVSIRIVPFGAGAHPGLAGPFIMMRIKESDETIVFLEGMGGDKLIKDDRADTDRYEEYLADLNQLALPPEDSDELLKQHIEQLQIASMGA
ncbi:MAG: DUF5753 domain-containing protein, partial [Streptosporangiaceae bacterium]